MNPISKTGYSIKWNSILVASQHLVSLAVGIVLARLLEPEEFGLVAMVNVFVAFSEVFIKAGTGLHIVQKDRQTQTDLSTILYFNIAIGLVFSCLLYISSGWIARFYDNNLLIAGIVQVLAWRPMIGSLAIVQQFLMVRKIDLKKRTLALLVGQIVAGILGVTLAIMGYGVYALVAAMIGSTLISTILYWVQSSWRPSFIFSRESLSNTWNFSGKILYTNILQQVVQRLDELIVGKYVSALSLGFYHRGKSLSTMPTRMFGQVLSRSFFPILSRIQSDKFGLLKYYKTQSERIMWLTIPVYIILIISAKDLIVILLGDKWLDAAPFFRLALIADFFYSNNVFKVYLLNALGKPEINLFRAAVLGPIRILLFLTPIIFFSIVDPYYLLGISILGNFVSFIWLLYNVQNLIQLRISEQLYPFFKYLIIAAICAVPLTLLTQEILNPFYSIGLSGLVFLIIYIGLLSLNNDNNTRKLITKGRFLLDNIY